MRKRGGGRREREREEERGGGRGESGRMERRMVGNVREEEGREFSFTENYIAV